MNATLLDAVTEVLRLFEYEGHCTPEQNRALASLRDKALKSVKQAQRPQTWEDLQAILGDHWKN